MKMRKFSGFFGLAVAGSLFLAGTAKAGMIYNLLAGPTTLDNLLIEGNSATVGNLSFTFSAAGFSSVVTGNSSLAPTPANITVSAFESVPGEPGLLFQGGWLAFNGSSDTRIAFVVTTLNGDGISDDYLATTGHSAVSSQWNVSETITNAEGASLGNNQISLSADPNTETLTQTKFFAPQRSLVIAKDINLTSTTGVAQISDVYQGFSTTGVPEPSTVGLDLLVGSGIAGVLCKRRRVVPIRVASRNI